MSKEKFSIGSETVIGMVHCHFRQQRDLMEIIRKF